MNRRIVTAGLVAALSTPAFAQQNTVLTPILVKPLTAETQDGVGLAWPNGAQ